MSWETFVVGTLEFVPDMPEEKNAKIITNLAVFEQRTQKVK
jgi:hypothetical protein